MYDVLVYLFENCQQAEVSDDRERVARKLSAAGFEDSDISEALHWLAGVARTPRINAELPDSRSSFRAFAPRELSKLDAECRRFLITLATRGEYDDRLMVVGSNCRCVRPRIRGVGCAAR